MENSVHATQTLRRLDMHVYHGGAGQIDTQYGPITVRKALTPGYVAEIGTGDVPDAYAFGATPAIAFLALGESLKDEEQRAKAAERSNAVIPFAKAA
jgi:hypothetical protein